MNIKQLNEALEKFLEGDVVSFTDYKRRKQGQPVAGDIKPDIENAKITKVHFFTAEGPIDWPYVEEQTSYDYEEAQDLIWKADYVCQKMQDVAKLNIQIQLTYENGEVKIVDSVRLYLGDGKEANDLIHYLEILTDNTLFITQEKPKYDTSKYQEEVDKRFELAKGEVKKENDKFANLAPAKNYGANKTAQDVEVGDILCVSWGYSMTLVDFYKVIERKKASIKLVSLGSKIVEGDGWTGEKVPTLEEIADKNIDGKIFRISNDNYSVCKIKNEYANYWNGEPKYFNTMD